MWSLRFAIQGVWLGGVVAACCGCSVTNVRVKGQVAPPFGQADVQAVVALSSAMEEATTRLPAPRRVNQVEVPKDDGELPPPRLDKAQQKPGKSFELPPGLPGADAPPIQPPPFQKDTPQAEREKAIRKVYPRLPALAADRPVKLGPPVTLAEFQRIAQAASPVLRRASAEADMAEGEVIQAGLFPNPEIGYQGDQLQAFGPLANAGQQGIYINQVLKRPKKLTLASAVAAFDHLNAQIGVRRATVDVTTQVRSAYFALVVAEKGVEVNRALTTLADEVYGLQLKQVAAGEVPAYEPLQLYAQAVQARNALVQAQTNSRAAWKQLTAAVGEPEAPPAPVAGRADAPPPAFTFDQLKDRLLHHTDMLTAQNSYLQAQVNLELQEFMPRPDLQTNTIVQYDFVTKQAQAGVQLGVNLPISDKNQGNIFKAKAQIGRATENINAVRNDLYGRLAEAFGRYQANLVVAENYRERIIPNLTRAYRAMIRRYQVEPDKVGFNDIIVAQQNLAQALQSYLAALDAQWRGVVDVANLVQLEDLYGWVECEGEPDRFRAGSEQLTTK